jgi:uncharacterized membrane protein
VPALLFLLVAVMLFPAVFFLAGIGYMITKAFSSVHVGETLNFIVIFGIHALIYFGLYYGISALLAKVISLIKKIWIRNSIVAAICLGLISLTQFTIYGGGGHGPMRLYTLSGLIAETNKTYGSGTFQIVYGITIILLIVIIFFPILSKSRKDKIPEKMPK